MHTVWKGAISFGLVHVPVKMFSATEDKDISMKYIHKECGSPISYVRRCPTCDVDVNWEDISRGYEYEKGKYVLFEKEELEQLSASTEKTITILDFVDLHEIDPIYFQKTYYLSPDQAGSNAYQLLLEAMRQSEKIGIAKIAIRSKSSLAAIRVMEGCLAVETIFFPDEIRPISQVPNLPENVNINDKELTMAKLLIEQLSTPFEPEKYNDDYRDNLLQLIEQKVAGEEISLAPAKPESNVIDLMAALQASIEAVKPIATDPGPGKAKRARGASATGTGTTGASAAAVDTSAASTKTSGTRGKKGSATEAPAVSASGAADSTEATGTGTAAPRKKKTTAASAAATSGAGPTETVVVPKPKRKSSKTAKKTIS